MKKRILILFIVFLLVFTPINFSYTVLGATEDLNTYNEVDGLGRISMNTNGSQVNITSMKNGDDNLRLFKDVQAIHGLQATDWSVSFEMFSPNSNNAGQRGTRLLGAGFSDTLGDVVACGIEHWCGIYVTTASPYLNRMIVGITATTVSIGSVTLGENQWYYAYFNRSGTTLTFSFYTDSGRTDAGLVETITYSSVTDEPFKYFYAAQSLDLTVYPDNQESWNMRNFELTLDGCLQPDAPTGGVVDYNPGTTTINLTWTKDSKANNTVIRYSNTAYPTSITDGTLWYNGTDTWFEDNGIDTSKFYYIRAWSESNWSSPNNYKVSTGYLQFDYGSLTINVYDENTSLPISDWGVFISDQDGTDTYEDTLANNPLVIPSTDIPFGDDTILVFNASNYSSRVYYYDLDFGDTYNINAYLPDINDTELYLITVENEYGEPVEDVNISFMRYINSTTEWANVSIQLTDGNGQVLVYLMYDNLYKVRLSKDGYQTSINDYIPSDSLFTKTFRIYFDDVEYMNETIYHEIISFTTEISGSNLFVNFTCSDSNIVTTNIVIYNISNVTGVRTPELWDNRTGDNSFSITHPIEDGMCYEITLGLVHSIFGTTNDSHIICDRAGVTTRTRFDTIFDLNFKYNPLGWSNTFGFFILLATMFSFGQQHVGVSMLLTGGVLIFINGVIGLSLVAVGIPLGIISLGILVLWGERGVKT